MLQELEEGVMHFVVNKNEVIFSEKQEFFRNWETRFQLIQVRKIFALFIIIFFSVYKDTFRTQEPILGLRRVILGVKPKYVLLFSKIRIASV